MLVIYKVFKGVNKQTLIKLLAEIEYVVDEWPSSNEDIQLN